MNLIGRIKKQAKSLNAELVEYKGIWEGRMLGSALLTHGSIFNVNAARDMAEMYGGGDVKQVVFGHTHTVGIGMARHQQPSMGINIGCMTDQRNMDYAANRRQTLAWTNAFIYGEYCKNDFKHHLEIVDNERPPVLKAVGQ